MIKLPQLNLKKLSNINYNLNLYFVFSFLLIVLVACIRFPSLTYKAEAWYETGSNYITYACHLNIKDALLGLDNGYLIIIQRFIALIAARLLPLKYYPYTVQWFAIIFVALCFSMINLKTFRKILPSDFLRFVVSILIGCIVASDSVFFIFNGFMYVGFIYILLQFFIDKENMKLVSFTSLLVLSVLIVLSKGTFIIMLPFFALYSIITLIQKNKKTALFYFFLSISAITQLLVMVYNQNNNWMAPQIGIDKLHPPSLLTTIYDTFVYYVQSYSLFIFSRLNVNPLIKNIVSILFIISASTFLVRFYKQKKISQNTFWFIIIANLIAIAYFSLIAYLQYTTLYEDFYITPKWTDTYILPHNQHLYVEYFLIFISVVVFLFYVIKSRIILTIVTIVITFLSILNNPDTIHDPCNFNNTPNTVKWKYFYKQIYDKQGFFPVNQYPYAYTSNTNVLNMGYENDYIPISINKPVYGINFNDYRPITNSWTIKGFYFQQEQNQIGKEFNFIAYDEFGHKIEKAKRYSPKESLYQTYSFSKEIKISRLVFFDEHMNKIKLVPKFKFVGYADIFLMHNYSSIKQLERPIDITKGETLIQEIHPPNNDFTALSIEYYANERENNCHLNLKLIDENQKIVKKESIDCKDLIVNSTINLVFKPIKNSKNKTYKLIITSPDADENNFVSIPVAYASKHNGELNLQSMITIFYTTKIP